MRCSNPGIQNREANYTAVDASAGQQFLTSRLRNCRWLKFMSRHSTFVLALGYPEYALNLVLVLSSPGGPDG